MEILIAVLIIAGIGLVAGLGLAIASIVMAVPKDEKAEAVLELLPGANCGACGYSGCSGYAAALAHGEADVYKRQSFVSPFFLLSYHTGIRPDLQAFP